MLGTVTFRGQSGEFYRFNVLPSDEVRTTKSSVCMFTQRTYNGTATLSRDVTGTHNIMFVGISDLINDDGRADEVIGNGANCVCVLAVDNKKKREEIEKDLIEKYNPEYNSKLKVLAASA